MSENEKANALLDDEQQEKTPENAEEKTEGSEEKKAITDPAEQLRKLCKGTLKLLFPFKAADQEVKELPFDLCALSGAEIASALDNVLVNNMFAITNEQALHVFALSAAKCAPFIERESGFKSRLYDAKDVKSRISAVDSIKAVQIAKLFYNASTQEGNKNISNG